MKKSIIILSVFMVLLIVGTSLADPNDLGSWGGGNNLGSWGGNDLGSYSGGNDLGSYLIEPNYEPINNPDTGNHNPPVDPLDPIDGNPLDPPTQPVIDIPARWDGLDDQTINWNSADNTLVYQDFKLKCEDSDTPVMIFEILSQHEDYQIFFQGKDLLIKDLKENYYGTETIMVACNSVKASFNLNVIIPGGEHPIANLGGPYYGRVGQEVFFDASQSSDNENIVNYHLEFGDGNQIDSSLPFVAYFYKEAGDYRITLTVTDNDGLTSQAITYAYITDGPIAPTANFRYTPLRPEAGQTVYFEDLSSDEDGNIIAGVWDFGDGSKAYTLNPQHRYDQDGKYYITLTVWDTDGLSDSLTQIIEIGQDQPSVTMSERTIFSRIRFNDYTHAGDILGINIGVLNDGTYNMEDMEITVHLLDLGERRTAGPFDVDDNSEETVNLYLDIPSDAESGEYDLRIIASNDDFRITEHRTITIN